MALTAKQVAFVEAYLGRCLFNATKSAIAAGYSESTAGAMGSENLKKPEIAAEISRKLAERSMGPNEVLDRLASIARNDAADYIHEGGYVDLARMKAEGNIHLVKGVKDTMAGKVIELMDPQAALGTLAKHHGLLRDQIEITALGRVSKQLDDLTDAELLALAERVAGSRSPRTADTGEAEAAGD